MGRRDVCSSGVLDQRGALSPINPLCPAAVLSCGENGEEWCSIESLITFDAGMGSDHNTYPSDGSMQNRPRMVKVDLHFASLPRPGHPAPCKVVTVLRGVLAPHGLPGRTAPPLRTAAPQAAPPATTRQQRAPSLAFISPTAFEQARGGALGAGGGRVVHRVGFLVGYGFAGVSSE